MVFEAYDDYGDKILNTPTSDLKRIYRDGKRLRVETKDKKFAYKDKDGVIHQIEGALQITVFEGDTEKEARRQLKNVQRALYLFKGGEVKLS